MNKVKARLMTRLVRDCTSWGDLNARLKALVTTDRKAAGDAFEVFVQAYLRSHWEYRTKLSDVWLLHEVPPDVREQLGLGSDEGIDLVARERRGDFWAIQAKFVGGPDEALTRSKVDSFISYAFNALRGKFAEGYIAHISTRPIRKRHLMPSVHELGLDRWLELDDGGGTGWRDVVRTLKRGEPSPPRRRDPKPHQRRAIDAAVKHFARESRGRLKMACGTGKSLIGLWVARALRAKTILVVAPSLQLIQRAVEDWSKEYLAYGERPDWACVCSDDTVTDDVDNFVTDTYESGLPTIIDPKKVAEWLRGNGTTQIVFTTYQSGETIAEAARRAGVTFDFAIFDEAHKTVGRRDKAFGRLLRDDFKVRRRMFMTATERIVSGADADVVYSMDDEEVYGKRFYDLEFGEAIGRGIITPFQVVTIIVKESKIKSLIDRNRLLDVAGLKAVKARDLATAVILNEAIEKHGIKKAIAYCPSILAGKQACKQQDALSATGRWTETANFHVSSELTAGGRADVIRKFEDATRPAIMFNARCLTEGVDIGTQKDRPVDAVAFTSPRRSVIDIVQAAGRAMRKGSEKKVGYVLIPIVVPDGMDLAKFAKTTPFKEMVRIIRALALADPRIVDELRALYYGKIPNTKVIKFDVDEPIGKYVSLDEFASAVRTRVWEVVARGNWRPFEDARTFVRSLGLKSVLDWNAYCRSGQKPYDIPADPYMVYANSGWISWVDWLGNGQRKGGWRNFEEARTFVQDLGLKSTTDWSAYCRSGQKPEDIPAYPREVYDKSGWISMGDWLGTGNRGNWRNFNEARAFVQNLGFKSGTDWRAYCRSGQKPDDIPVKPHAVYADSGWVDLSDWLGNGRRIGDWRDFEEARAFVQDLGLKSGKQWSAYCRSGQKPNDIPGSPYSVYAKSGWIGMGDWLGTGNRKGDWRNFEEARAFMQDLGLKSGKQWLAYCRSGQKPNDIPAAADRVYAESGWNGWDDFLGTDNRNRGDWRNFEEARAFVQDLGLKSEKQWRAYCRSGKKPNDIPAAPSRTYAESGWISMGDWLGTGRGKVDWRNFEDARTFVHSLGFKSESGWRKYCRSGQRPADIPAKPDRVFAESGWVNWGDWLGTGRRKGATGVVSRKRAPSCGVLDLSLAPIGKPTAAQEKSPTTSRKCP